MGKPDGLAARHAVWLAGYTENRPGARISACQDTQFTDGAEPASQKSHDPFPQNACLAPRRVKNRT
ncbi:hypothetical protein CFR78_08275 [Komagataeibacter rhaeticus]|nr:hypothetical protein GLUCORHAEAF1_13050 [Komagataeibacter rhaeticus AF1]PYD53618.1 hypothetical protein CFR78_08275 [Komagataeibacter rhaeticus]